MMSLATIQQFAAEAAEAAERDALTPRFVPKDWAGYTKEEKVTFARTIPNIGSYVPDGVRLVRRLFVDKSGMGSEGEPALTFEAFISELEPGKGYAIVEEGQFQIYVGVFEKR